MFILSFSISNLSELPNLKKLESPELEVTDFPKDIELKVGEDSPSLEIRVTLYVRDIPLPTKESPLSISAQVSPSSS